MIDTDDPRTEKDLTQYAVADCNSVDDAAARSGISKFHFCRLFKTQTGLTPWHYIQDKKIEQAKGLLISSRLSIKELAGLLGFGHPDYFAKIFREKTGVTPKVFRGRLTK